MGPIEIFCTLIKTLAIGGGILFGLGCAAILWLCLAGLRQKNT